MKLARNQFEFVQYAGLVAENVLPEEFSIREFVWAECVYGRQGYQ